MFSSAVQSDNAVTTVIIELVQHLLNPAGCPSVLRVGVAYGSKVLWKYGPDLSDAYVKAMLRIPADARARLLDSTGVRDELAVCVLN